MSEAVATVRPAFRVALFRAARTFALDSVNSGLGTDFPNEDFGIEDWMISCESFYFSNYGEEQVPQSDWAPALTGVLKLSRWKLTGVRCTQQSGLPVSKVAVCCWTKMDMCVGC